MSIEHRLIGRLTAFVHPAGPTFQSSMVQKVILTFTFTFTSNYFIFRHFFYSPNIFTVTLRIFLCIFYVIHSMASFPKVLRLFLYIFGKLSSNHGIINLIRCLSLRYHIKMSRSHLPFVFYFLYFEPRKGE